MNIATTLSVYNKADNRFKAGTATKADEVLLALWDELKAKALIVRGQAAEIDMLKMREAGSNCITPELGVVMSRFCNGNLMLS